MLVLCTSCYFLMAMCAFERILHSDWLLILAQVKNL